MRRPITILSVSMRNYVQCLVCDKNLVHARSIRQAGIIRARGYSRDRVPKRSVKSALTGYHNPKYALSTHRPTLKPSRDMMYPTNNGNRGARRSSVRMRKGRAVERYIITPSPVTVMKTYH